MIERKGKPWWTWQWRAHLITLMLCQQGTFSKSPGQCIDSDDDLFFSRTKAHGGGVKSGKVSESHWRINPTSLIVCLHIHLSEATSTVQGLQVHTTSGPTIKKKRPLQNSYSETKQSVISSHNEIRYRANSHMAYCLPHTPFTLYIAETNDNRTSTPKRLE